MGQDMSCAVDDERWLYSNWVYLDCGSSVFSVGMHTRCTRHGLTHYTIRHQKEPQVQK